MATGRKHSSATRARQAASRGGDAGIGGTSRAWVHSWKADQEVVYMARVLAAMLWSGESWTRWMSALVRSQAGLAGGLGGSPGQWAEESSAEPFLSSLT